MLATGTDLRSLSWDRTGLVWAVDQVPGGSRIIVATPDGAVSEVPTPQILAGRDIDDLAVSPDGSRVAVAVEGELMVGIVLRDPAQTTASIEGLRRVQIDDRVGTSVAWSGLTELAILVQRDDESTDPYRVGISGSDLRPAGTVTERRRYRSGSRTRSGCQHRRRHATPADAHSPLGRDRCRGGSGISRLGGDGGATLPPHRPDQVFTGRPTRTGRVPRMLSTVDQEGVGGPIVARSR